MSPINALSELDQNLIRLLEAEARMSITGLAKALSVSRATVQEHMQRLEQQGVIQGYTVKLSPELESRRVCAFIMLSVDQKQLSSLARQIKNIEAVTSLVSVSGQYDLIATVWESTTEALDKEIDRLTELDGVERTLTSIVLSTKFDR